MTNITNNISVVNTLPNSHRNKGKSPKFSTEIVMAVISGVFLVLSVATKPWWVQYFKTDSTENKVIDPATTVTSDGLNQKKLNNYPGLKLISNLQSGKRIVDLPNQIWGYSSPIEVVFETRNKNGLLTLTAEASPDYRFEVQKIEDESYLVGFISEENYSNLGSINTEKTITMMVFPNLWSLFNHKVSIPFKSIIMANYREIPKDGTLGGNVYVLDITTTSVSASVYRHE